MRPNWFIGLPVPAFDGYEALFDEAPEGLRRFHADDLHITVAFLGAVSEDDAQTAWTAAVAPEEGPFEISLGSVEAFGRRSKPSAFSFVLAEGRDAVAAYIARVRDPALAAAGARPDDRPPRPHITIARPPRHTDRATRLRMRAWAEALPHLDVYLVLDRLALFTWSDQRSTRQFQIVEARPLGPIK